MAAPGGKINLRLISFLLAFFERQREESERAADKLPGILDEFPFYWVFDRDELEYVRYQLEREFGPAAGYPRGAGFIDRHLSHMANLGLIRRTEEDYPDRSWPLNGWRLSNADELAEQMRERDAGSGTRATRSDGAEPPIVASDNVERNGDGTGNPGGNGNGNGGGNDTGGPGDPGDRPGGIGQVLSHPVLFALPGEEFDAAVERLFDGVGAL